MTHSLVQLLIVSLIVPQSLCQAKNVVMIPPPMKSYIIYHANIGQALVELGHNVSMCVPEYLANKRFVPHEDIHIMKYGDYLGDVEVRLYKETRMIDRFWAGEAQTIRRLFPSLKTFKEVIEKILSDETFITSLRDMKPDFLVIENFMFTRNILVLPYKLDIPFGLIETFHDYFISRVPFSPATDPLFFEKGSNEKSFLERVNSFIASVVFIGYDMFSDSDIVSRHAPEKPYKTIREIALMAEIFITETDHILDYPRATLPNTKLVGGSSVSEAKPLSGDLKSFVENSSNGIAVVSFGGGDIIVPDHIRSKMVNAFQNLNLNIVWKINWTSDQPDKILSLKWIPQNDILGHPKTKVFVSHCGKNGQYEALYHGVPIFCLPIYGDQFYNSKRISVKEFGLSADIREITSEELTKKIQQVAGNPKYKANIREASKIFKELYKVPSKEAAFWFDHVMRYGGDYMKSSGQQMPLYQFLLLDVVAFLFIVILIALLVIYFIFRICYNRLKKSKVKTA